MMYLRVTGPQVPVDSSEVETAIGYVARQPTTVLAEDIRDLRFTKSRLAPTVCNEPLQGLTLEPDQLLGQGFDRGLRGVEQKGWGADKRVRAYEVIG
jgi:hypothetical protein